MDSMFVIHYSSHDTVYIGIQETLWGGALHFQLYDVSDDFFGKKYEKEVIILLILPLIRDGQHDGPSKIS